MFSYLMGSFITILANYQNLNANLDDGETLAKFFGTMQHFNDQKGIDDSLKK